MDKDARIYVAGHRGLLGTALVRMLRERGYENLLLRTSAELDLRRQADVEAFFEREKPQVVFLAAARVGGIWANMHNPAPFFYDNVMIQTNVIHAAWRFEAERLLFVSSSCSYPRLCPQPMKEEYILTGPPEPTNEAYAIAKIGGMKMIEAYHRQYGVRFFSVIFPWPLIFFRAASSLSASSPNIVRLAQFWPGRTTPPGYRRKLKKSETTSSSKAWSDFVGHRIACATARYCRRLW